MHQSFNQAQRGLPTWITAHPDNPPATPNTKDDEFDGAAGSALDSKWVGYGQTLTTAVDGLGRLVITAPLNSGTVPNIAAIEQAAPTGNFEIRMKGSQMSALSFSIYGIYLRRSGNLANIVNFRNSSGLNDLYIQTSRYTSPTSRVSANDTALSGLGFARDTWLRITYISGTISYQFCLGVPYTDSDWKTLSSEADSAFLGGAPTQIGISADSLSSTVQAKAGIFYFRVAALP
jgi:hypothetical protein